jgi:23S rRNA (guanine745-N1)-methyltransferase
MTASATEGSSVLICPHCRAPLVRAGAGYRCPEGHAFDIAREGYVNLLRTRQTGDSAEMLRARRAFLEREHYAPLADALCDIVGRHLGASPHGERPISGDSTHILDCGCGEGYYLGRLRRYLAASRRGDQLAFWGLDSAKDAARMAARRHPGIGFVVADCKDMVPFADTSLHALLTVFAPRHVAEFARVLASGALLLIAIPSENHLIQLRAPLGLLGMEDNKLQHVRESLVGHFDETATPTVEYTMDLSAEDVILLATMMPSHRHNPAQRLALVETSRRYAATAAFTLLACRRV